MAKRRGGNQNSKKYTQKGISSSLSRSTKFCEHCKLSGHEKRKSWKLHPELFPTKWKKDEKGKRTMTAAIFDDHIELGQVEKADISLSLMAMPKETTSNLPTVFDEKEELFTLRIQVKHKIIEAIVDTEGTQDLSLVQIPFAITNQYIDEVTCEVVPLDICRVIFGNPYLWERDARRMINASQKFVLMMIRPVENEVKASSLTLSCRALDSKLNELLGKLTNLFTEVGGLPPKRAVEHEIQLISDSTLPNLCMYCNSVMENEEIKQHVIELLDTCVIKPSSSP
ncbi:hypothetical protein NC651_018100 [Populus alba x Populus x berolinensis]|nr:hypothetical protein NC651_018100 [Populus alba x Populus x berolinensis]